jgi:hypothetical protein
MMRASHAWVWTDHSVDIELLDWVGRREARPKEDAMRTILPLATVFVVELCFGLTAADANPCTDQITQIEHVMQQPKVNTLAPQTVVAQLHHQPTPETVENAAEKGRAEVGALLARAKVLDAEGNAAECMNVVSRLKIQLGPGAPATGGQLPSNDEAVGRRRPPR